MFCAPQCALYEQRYMNNREKGANRAEEYGRKFLRSAVETETRRVTSQAVKVGKDIPERGSSKCKGW